MSIKSKTPYSWKKGDHGDSIMLQARRARVQAEEDVKLMENRLKHLKLEEDRVKRRIQETESKAKEVLDLKKKHHEVKVTVKAREETV